MRLGIAEILKEVASKPNKQEKINELRKHANNNVLTLLLKMSMDPGLQWRIPPGTPEYKPAVNADQQGMLYSSIKLILRLFIINPMLPPPPTNKRQQAKIEMKFIEVLETLHPDDAKLLVAVKDKKPLAPGITKKLVDEALPGLLQ